MFKKTDEGRLVRINNRRGADWITEGSELKIGKYVNSLTVKFHNNNNIWTARNLNDITFLDENKEILVIGDPVILTSNTTSLKRGEKATILSFVEDDPNKPVIKGIIPGGWINPSKLCKQIDLKKNRVKSAIAIFAKESTSFLSICGAYTNIFGKTLEEIEAIQIDSEIVYKKKNIIINKSHYTSEEIEPMVIVIVADNYVIKIVNTEKLPPKNIGGKLLREFYKKLDEDDDQSVIAMFNDALASGCIPFDRYYGITFDGIKIITKKEYEQKNLTIPFA